MVKTFSYQLFKSIRGQLLTQYSEEANTLAFLIITHFSGFTNTDILVDKSFTTGPQFEVQLQSIIKRLKENEPIQYVLGNAYFYDRPFIVNEYTLIPRQETEELVYLVLKELSLSRNLTILDIGTGSGCIPITLKLEANQHQYEGIDISEAALEIATQNAKLLSAKVVFNHLNILKERLPKKYDIIISNPPYVLENEKPQMKQNVLAHEPHSALFVPNTNPLLFYKRITQVASNHLNPNGKLYFEINEQFGKEVVDLLVSHSFTQITLHQDLNGKDRFVSGKY
ncbi:MAG: peptide chain release factor N(5)-glutamine methyltransferase [Cyclobacteriaceae bacterium]|nr:peptide chain release factor N(5)-glutamine methyltransferase [Cyclobacteriaceae bacterium]